MPRITLNELKEKYIGEVFGKWTITDVFYLQRKDGRNRSSAQVVCGCGTEKVVTLKDVTAGKSTNCGCVRNAKTSVLGKQSVTHGMTGSPEFRVWSGMLSRCGDLNVAHYPRYGGRGITVCPRWAESFESFYQDMGVRPKGTTLERRDNDKGYSPDNCVWATSKTQANNRRSNRLVCYGGEIMTLSQAADKSEHTYSTVYGRIRRGWDIDDAVNLPLKQ